MKAVLEFDLDDADDMRAHLRAVKSLDMALVLWEILYNFNKKGERYIETLKEGDRGYDVLDFFMGQVRGLCDEHGIIIDDLVV